MTEYFLVFLLLMFASIAFYLVYDRYVRKSSRSDNSNYIQALCDLLDGKPESAFAELRQVGAEDADNLDAYLRLGQILREHKQPQRAIQVHKDLTLRSNLSRSEKTAILRQLTLDYLDLEDYETAASALEELIELDSHSRWALVQRLKLQEQVQQWDEAFQTASQLLKLEGSKSKSPLARYKYMIGDQLYKKREYHKARIAFKEALGLDPACIDAYLAIGDSYYDEKRFEDAVIFWNKLISAVPDKGHLVIERLKRTLFDLGRFGDIMEICQRILQSSPKNVEARLALARFYESKGELDSAVELLEQVVDDYPDNSLAVLELVNRYIEKKDQRKVTDLLRTVERKKEIQRKVSSTASTTQTTSV
jgi:lipopolysaccharide biosynthesis regulator YciM